MTAGTAVELAAKHGGILAAAKAIHMDCLNASGRIPTVNAVRQWIQEATAGRSFAPPPAIYDQADADKLNQIKNLLDEAGVPLDAIGRIQNVKVKSGFHEGLTKGPDGAPVVTRLRSKNASLLLSPKWEDGPAWPVVQQATPVRIAPTPTRKFPKSGKRVAVISDLQIGFLRDVQTEEMVPIHDPKAIEVALRVIADVQPEQIVYVGDFLDLPEMSRWLQLAEFSRTTQPALDEGYRILARFEAAAGKNDRRLPTQFVAGNHDRRLREYAQINAKAAFGLRPADTTPESWPDLSLPHLLRFDELGIEYVGEYPGGEFWVTPTLVVRHNPESKDAYAASVIAGHTHRIARSTYTRRTQTGPETHTLYEIGCLCSLDNYPDKRSLMATRVPSNRGFVKNWAQGFAIVHLDDDGDYYVEQIEIQRASDGPKAIRPGGRTYAA